MTRALAAVAAALLAAWALAAAPPGAPAGAEDVQDVALFVGGRAVRLRLHIVIDGKPFQGVHRDALDGYLDDLFTQLDSDGDGFLSEKEAVRMPPPFKTPGDAAAGAVNVAFNYRVVDADGDGRITRAELGAYHREFSGGPMQIQPAVRTAVPPAADEALFALLDANKDGKLSRDELAAAANVLLPLDLDHDELLTPQEILPSLYAVPPAAPVPVGAMRAARPTQAVVMADADTDKAGAPDAEIVVRLGVRGQGQAPLEVLRPERKTDGKAVRIQPSGDDGLMLIVEGGRVELRVNAGRPAQPEGIRRRTLDLFRGADAAGKGYLTVSEAQRTNFFPAHFAVLDQNADGKLTERELTTYLNEVQERQARLFAASPALVASERGQGLFAWLDQDRDGRLSLRELRDAPKLLARLGRETEGSLTREDLPANYQLAFGLGQASLGPAGPGAFTPREAPMLTLDWAEPGLLWFYKMDRNRDGAVSRREFLGTAADFRRIDADGDGLISRVEAERANGLFGKK